MLHVSLFFLSICLLLLLCYYSITALSWKLCPLQYGSQQYCRNFMPLLHKLANHTGLQMLGILSHSRFLLLFFLPLLRHWVHFFRNIEQLLKTKFQHLNDCILTILFGWETKYRYYFLYWLSLEIYLVSLLL